MSADKMFKELGYKLEKKYSNGINYIGEDEDVIAFIKGYQYDNDKVVKIEKFYDYITIPELQAINQKCKELGWIQEEN